MFKQIVLIIIPSTFYLFISKKSGLILFSFLILWFLYGIFVSYLFAKRAVKRGSPAAICLGLQQAGHPYYQIDLEMGAGMASYIPALNRRPTNADLFWGLFFCRLFGRINQNNLLL